jgi:hypothetical protein
MFNSSTSTYLESLFYAVPLAILPLLNSGARLDLWDLHRAEQYAAVSNNLNGETSLEKVDANSLTLRYTPASTWKMELLPDSTIRITRTFFARDTSQITELYNKRWQRIKK